MSAAGSAMVRPRVGGAVLVALSCLMFAAMAIVVRTLSGVLGAGQIALARFVVGLVLVFGVLVGRRRRPTVPRPFLWASRGLFGGLAVYLYYVAVREIGVGPATMLNYVAPCYATLFAVLYLKEKPPRQLLIGLGVATVGAVIVALSTVEPTRTFALGTGAWAGMGAAVLSGAAMTTVRALRADADSPTVFLGFCLFGGIVTFPISWADWHPVPGSVLWSLLAVGLLSFGAQMLFTWGFGYVSASAGSAITQLIPALTWAMAVCFLAEVPRPLTVVGAVMCAAGVVLGTWSGRRPS